MSDVTARCRKCHATHYGVLAKGGELPFIIATPDRPSWMAGL